MGTEKRGSSRTWQRPRKQQQGRGEQKGAKQQSIVYDRRDDLSAEEEIQEPAGRVVWDEGQQNYVSTRKGRRGRQNKEPAAGGRPAVDRIGRDGQRRQRGEWQPMPYRPWDAGNRERSQGPHPVELPAARQPLLRGQVKGDVRNEAGRQAAASRGQGKVNRELFAATEGQWEEGGGKQPPRREPRLPNASVDGARPLGRSPLRIGGRGEAKQPPDEAPGRWRPKIQRDPDAPNTRDLIEALEDEGNGPAVQELIWELDLRDRKGKTGQREDNEIEQMHWLSGDGVGEIDNSDEARQERSEHLRDQIWEDARTYAAIDPAYRLSKMLEEMARYYPDLDYSDVFTEEQLETARQWRYDKMLQDLKERHPYLWRNMDVREQYARIMQTAAKEWPDSFPILTSKQEELAIEYWNKLTEMDPLGGLGEPARGYKDGHPAADIHTNQIPGRVLRSNFYGEVVDSYNAWDKDKDGKSNEGSYGNYITIRLTDAYGKPIEDENGNQIYIFMAHFESVEEDLVGKRIFPGEQLGIVGKTGNIYTESDGPYAGTHVHIEARTTPEVAYWNQGDAVLYDPREYITLP